VIHRIALLLLCSMTAWLSGCGRQEVFHGSFLAFGTLNEVSIAADDADQAAAAVAALEQDFAEMHREWHGWEPGPVVWMNQRIAAGDQFEVPLVVAPLLERSRELAEASDNLFNPAIGHLLKAWGFQGQADEGWHPPSAEQVRQLVAQNPRLSDLEISEGKAQSRNPMVALDFGAIGKGFGVDFAIDRLRQLGIANAIVNSGGDLRAIGSAYGRPWRIGIRNPRGPGAIAAVQVHHDEAVFTSGDYERSHAADGKRYTHILDPRTGYPVEHTASVTVIHASATTADAAATALFVAGPGEWPRIARSMGITQVMLIDRDGNFEMTPAMAERVELLTSDPEIRLYDPWQQTEASVR